MRYVVFILPALLLTACTPQPSGSGGANFVKVDGYRIDVAYLGGRVFSARGGEETHDKWVKYRQVRAIEVISLCQVTESHYQGRSLTATVGCAHPRTHP